MKLTGQVWKYGDNVDTDVIIPARYLNMSTAEELAAHCMEDIDPSFAQGLSEPATSSWPAPTSAAAPRASTPRSRSKARELAA